MSEKPRVNRGTVLKLSGIAAGAVLADILAQEPGDANLPINMTCGSNNSPGAMALRRHRSPKSGMFNEIYIYLWDYDTNPDHVPKYGDASILFDNRIVAPNANGGYLPAGGGNLTGYYGTGTHPERLDQNSNPVPHPGLFIVVSLKPGK